MVDKKFLLSQGFKIADTAEPFFELAVKKFSQDTPDPKFPASAKTAKIEGKKGFRKKTPMLY